MQKLEQSLVRPTLPLSLRKTRYCCAPAIQTSRVVGLTEVTTVAGSKMVSTPLVTVPSDDEISSESRVHVVLGLGGAHRLAGQECAVISR